MRHWQNTPMASTRVHNVVRETWSSKTDIKQEDTQELGNHVRHAHTLLPQHGTSQTESDVMMITHNTHDPYASDCNHPQCIMSPAMRLVHIPLSTFHVRLSTTTVIDDLVCIFVCLL